MLQDREEERISICAMDHVVYHTEHLHRISEERVKEIQQYSSLIINHTDNGIRYEMCTRRQEEEGSEISRRLETTERRNYWLSLFIFLLPK